MKSTTDMTVGSPTRHLILFALPALIGNIFQQVYNIADSAIVGRFVGPDALAAVGATGSITFLFFALCNGIGSGGGIIVSQFYGAHDDECVKKSIVNTGIIMLIIPACFAIIGYLSADNILRILSTPNEILADATSYVRYMCMGLLFVYAMGLKITSVFYPVLGLIYVVRGVLNGVGDAFFALFNGLIEVVGRFTVPILFTRYLGMGATGIWVSAGIVWAISGITAWMRLVATHVLSQSPSVSK